MDADLILALELQEQFDREFAKNINDSHQNVGNFSVSCRSPSKPLSIIDESWELTDPSPDIRALFLQFNDRFFWGKLAGVEVRWSPRMTMCAGICCYEGRGGLCSVRLSKPLLQLRPRKDLVETLLHEMIHALLFVTQNNKDHDGHGPEFQKHMNRINNETGTKISIYHNFHDEVAYFQQHWWRCNGPCQKRKPYFGYVKRAMNRAPSPRDFWWGEHQRSCGGTYTKIKEPEGYGQKKKGKSKTEKDEKSDIKTEKPKGGNMDIRLFTGSGVVLGGGKLKTESETKTNTSASGSKKLPSSTVTRLDSECDSESGLSSLNSFLKKGISAGGSKKQLTSTVTRTDSECDSKPDLPSLDPFLRKGNSNTNVVGKGGALLNKEKTGETKLNNISNTSSISGIKKNVETGGTFNGAKQKSNTSSTISGAKKPGLNTTSTGDSFKTNTAVKQKSPSFKKGIFTIGNVDKAEDNESKTTPTAEAFSGSGQTLGKSNSLGGNGVLALLRKQWEKERTTKNESESKNTNKLMPPSNINHRKRNSDEFLVKNEFDFKKLKIEKDEKKSKKTDRSSLNTVPNKNASKNIPSNSASMGSSLYSSDGDVIVLGHSDNESKDLHTCPVCLTMIEFTLINQHLDRCLSE